MSLPTSSDDPIGYGAIATAMSGNCDLSIYRRFGVLNSRNLLYLQSEVMALETQLQELDAATNDMQKGNSSWSIPWLWYYLERAGGEHLDTVLRVREVL